MGLVENEVSSWIAQLQVIASNPRIGQVIFVVFVIVYVIMCNSLNIGNMHNYNLCT